jgi:hypothetical protein
MRSPCRAGNKIPDDALDAVEPRQHLPVRGTEVALIHRAGYVDGQNKIARGDFTGEGIADPLRPGQRYDDQDPDQDRDDHLRGAPPPYDRALLRSLSGRGGEAIEERHLHRGLPRSIGRQQPPDQKRQRQQRKHPGPCELKHDGL